MQGFAIRWASTALVILAACAGDDSEVGLPDDRTHSSRDSAGVEIVESPGRILDTAMPWVVDSVPSLQLGAFDGPTPVVFRDIRGIEALPDGGIVVLDGGSGELRWFDSSGQHRRTAGGRGPGPGEFFEPLLVPQFKTDSLLIFDRARRAFTRVAIDGSGERAMRSGGQGFAGSPRTAAGARALFTTAFGSESCLPNRPCELGLVLRRVNVDGSIVDTLAVHPIRMMNFTESGPPVLLTGPLDSKGLAAAAPAGLVIEGDPRFELRQFDNTGRLVAIFRVKASSRTSPRKALEQYVQQRPNPAEMMRIYELMGLPETLPAFQELRVDQLGWYWAELFHVGERASSKWLVFDPGGNAQGLVELPRDLEVHTITATDILGRWVDELGVEYVRRYAMHRR